jgi:hypothetical protein
MNLYEYLRDNAILNEVAAADEAVSVRNAVMDEGEDALPLYIAMKGLSAALDKAMEMVGEKALKEAEELSGRTKTTEYKGCKIQVKEVGAKWHFDKTNDAVLFSLQSEAEQAKAKEKDRQDFLKALKEPMDFVDANTGEVVKIFPPYKTSKTGIAVSLPKAID